MTSISAGSPQFVKEAMACNKSVVSTDVGDVKELFLHTKNSLICSYEVADVVLKLKQVLSSHINNDSRDYVQTVLANHLIAEKILKVYNIAKKI
jgi:glycosyltransferase involved in cell wall biosynthesis